jgi:hypothetical protein
MEDICELGLGFVETSIGRRMTMPGGSVGMPQQALVSEAEWNLPCTITCYSSHPSVSPTQP